MQNTSKANNPFFRSLGADYPIIMAPMFLVTNTGMMVAALQNGITAAIPALNFRTDEALRAAIRSVREQTDRPFGINLIVNKSNIRYRQQLETCIEMGVGFIITSLGSPREVIERCKPKGIKVLCDVVDLKYALKVAELGADAVIAVSNRAGGHAGHQAPEKLIPELKAHLTIPVIAAGGIATPEALREMLALGAEGVSVGTVFIATQEAGVSEEYKQALVDYNAEDVILTRLISGTPLTVIKTPYVASLGDSPGLLVRLMQKNKWLKKYIKMLITVKGMRSLQRSAFSATYKTVWVAGPSISHIHEITSIKKVVSRLTEGLEKISS